MTLEASDPGDDTVTQWTIDWGDGSADETFTKQPDDSWLSDGSGTLTAVTGEDNQWTVTHTYADDGDYTVKAWAVDEDNDAASAYAAFNAGELDTHFASGNGYVLENFSSLGNSSDAHATDMVVQPDGKIIVAGHADGDILLVRYNADGTLDTNFGTNGLVKQNLGGTDYCSGVSLQTVGGNAGKIVVAGRSNDEVALARFTADGQLDNDATTGFGTGNSGIIIYSDFCLGKDYANEMTLLSNDDIIIVGKSETGVGTGLYGTLVARFSCDGDLDTSFNSNTGYLIFPSTQHDDHATAVEVLWQRTTVDETVLVAAGSYDEDHGLFFFDAAGNALTGFGTNGVIQESVGSGSNQAFGLAIDRGATDSEEDDKILTAGYNANNGCDRAMACFSYDSVNEDFILDTSFDSDGKFWFDYDGEYDHAYGGLTILSNGQIVTSGQAGIDGQYDLGISCHNTDASLVADFGNYAAGKSTFDYGDGNECGLAITTDTGDNILTAGYAKVGSSDQFIIARYLSPLSGHQVTVENVAPTLEVVSESLLYESVGDDKWTYIATIQSQDPGDDSLNGWVINWGDSTTETIERQECRDNDDNLVGYRWPINVSVSEPGLWIISHDYTSDGEYTINFSATDEDATDPENPAVTLVHSMSSDEESMVTSLACTTSDLVLEGTGNNNVSMTLESDKTVDEGDTFSLKIIVSNNPQDVSEILIDWKRWYADYRNK